MFSTGIRHSEASKNGLINFGCRFEWSYMQIFEMVTPDSILYLAFSDLKNLNSDSLIPKILFKAKSTEIRIILYTIKIARCE